MSTSDSQRTALYLLGYLLMVAAILGSVLWDHQGRRRMVEELDPGDRQVVFESTMQSFDKLCTGREATRFETYCAGQREFLKLFPECNQTCRDTLTQAEPGATR